MQKQQPATAIAERAPTYVHCPHRDPRLTQRRIANDFPIVDHALSLEVRGDGIREALGSPERGSLKA